VKTLARVEEFNPKMQAFADYYIECQNATEAYQKAYGCAYTTAKNKGHKLLKRDAVKRYIERMQARISDERILSAQQVLEELSRIAMNDEESTSSRLKSLELLGKHNRLFVDKVEQENTNVEVNLGFLDDEIH
jgi:phage terminase small subunit